jgi:thymidylate synthase
MKKYQDLVHSTLENGTYKPNRTGVDTISTFSYHYKIDLEGGFPLLTTKDMSGFRWNSLIHEILWYLSGEEHIKNLREETKIWDAWADEEGQLDTAYGRFWRRYPIPEEHDQLPGESWAHEDFVTVEGFFDQIEYALHQLENNPHSRRIVINAWHPANAAVSTLPPCHYTWVLNVQDGRLNTHLTQRSGDIALGIPFNIAAYGILTQAIAQQVGLEVGEFGHSIVDAHVYCGEGERGEWYEDNLDELQERLRVNRTSDYGRWNGDIKSWIESEAPEDPDSLDHVPGLLEQLEREPRAPPALDIADKPLEELEFEDFTLRDYDPDDGIYFGVAE